MTQHCSPPGSPGNPSASNSIPGANSDMISFGGGPNSCIFCINSTKSALADLSSSSYCGLSNLRIILVTYSYCAAYASYSAGGSFSLFDANHDGYYNEYIGRSTFSWRSFMGS